MSDWVSRQLGSEGLYGTFVNFFEVLSRHVEVGPPRAVALQVPVRRARSHHHLYACVFRTYRTSVPNLNVVGYPRVLLYCSQ